MSLLSQASLCVTPSAYKEGKLYSVIPSDGSGDLSVTRATTATRVNSAGLIELVPYNIVNYSEQFDNAAWTKVDASVTANTTTAPDGTLTADTITDNSTLDRHITYQSLDSERSLTRTLSTYAKQGTLRYLALSVTITSDSTACYSAIFDLQTGTITATKNNGSATISASIENAGNGWYRCIISGALGNGFETIYPVIATSDRAGFTGSLVNNNLPIYAGSGQSLYIWGAQLNEGTLLPYQKTETRLNIPRLDYSNGTCPSLLVEPQRTNLVTYSSSFDNAAWFKLNATITANNTTSPSGIQDADAIVDDATNDVHITYLFVNKTTGNSWTCYMKKGTLDYGYISAVQSSTLFTTCIINLTNGAIHELQNGSSTTGTVTTEDVGNGWYRVKMQTNVLNAGCSFGTSDGSALSGATKQAIYTGTGSGTIYLWGAQSEDATYSTSYIPTTSASVTRNADVISKTGISSLIGTEFTVFLDANESFGASSRYLVLKGSGGTYANAVFLEANASNQIALTVLNNSSATVFGGLSSSLTSGQRFKLAVRCKNNDFAFYVNGVQVATQASGSVPTTSDLYLGYYSDYSDNYNTINSAAIWTTALTNAQLATLTSL
jgi:hypothetical protein